MGVKKCNKFLARNLQKWLIEVYDRLIYTLSTSFQMKISSLADLLTPCL